MEYFNPKPDFRTISKHYTLPYEAKVMEKDYGDGFPIVLDHIYTDEAVAQIKEGFLEIIKRYQLNDHYDNLLFLLLNKVAEHEAILDELHFQYGQRRRTKELAGLLLALANNTVCSDDVDHLIPGQIDQSGSADFWMQQMCWDGVKVII